MGRESEFEYIHVVVYTINNSFSIAFFCYMETVNRSTTQRGRENERSHRHSFNRRRRREKKMCPVHVRTNNVGHRPHTFMSLIAQPHFHCRSDNIMHVILARELSGTTRVTSRRFGSLTFRISPSTPTSHHTPHPPTV